MCLVDWPDWSEGCEWSDTKFGTVRRVLVFNFLMFQLFNAFCRIMGRGGGFVVSVLAFTSDDPCFNPGEVANSFSVKCCLKRMKINRNRSIENYCRINFYSFFKKSGPFSNYFSLFSSFQYSWQSVWRCPDSNSSPLVSEATTLPTEPQPLPNF